MLCELWVGQDLFAELESVSVLLVFVASLSKKKRGSTLEQENKSDTTEKDRRRGSIKVTLEFTAFFLATS